MKAGAMTMEWKWSSSQVSGSIQHHYDPKEVLQVKFNVKIMLICFIEASRIVYKELSSLGQTVNQTFYLVVLRCLQDAVQRKYPVLWQNGEWWFHRNNAPAHTTLSVRVSHKQWHDPNYPLSLFIQSCSLWHFLFSQMKTVAKRKHLADMEEVKKKKRQKHWMAYLCNRSRNALYSGKHICTGALLHMEIEGYKSEDIKIYLNSIIWHNSGYFWVPLSFIYLFTLIIVYIHMKNYNTS